jgi:tRNA G10  N-methylase Trm11
MSDLAATNDFGIQLEFDSSSFARLTHYLFRYPAKFHPPVAKALLSRYVERNGWVLDPFCGSGSLLVEARAAGIHSMGVDIDPVAVFVSDVKTRCFSTEALTRASTGLFKSLKPLRRSQAEYNERQFVDILDGEMARAIVDEQLPVPAIPNLTHWFRKYVVVDLGRILRAIHQQPMSQRNRDFFSLCFAATIRAASNADPVPVSGLEVTSHMKKKDEAGRVIDPFALFEKSVNRSLQAISEFGLVAKPSTRVRTSQADATLLKSSVFRLFDAVITSPPYHNAVDYYRRHQLEMYWLGMTKSQAERLDLLPKYIGRPSQRRTHPFVQEGVIQSDLARQWEERIRVVDPRRADNFKHYVVAMSRVFGQISRVLRRGGNAVFVVGHSTWNGDQIPTAELMKGIAGDKFEFVEQLSYPVPNRYMSYARRNGASIDREYVVAFHRTKK